MGLGSHAAEKPDGPVGGHRLTACRTGLGSASRRIPDPGKHVPHICMRLRDSHLMTDQFVTMLLAGGRKSASGTLSRSGDQGPSG